MASASLVLFDSPVPPAILDAFGGLSNIPEKQTVPQLSFRGKVWRIILNGKETIVNNSQGDPVQSVNLIMLNLHPRRSRAYFEGNYVEGQSRLPNCWSNDGITPDASIAQPQCETCAACPQAAKGSKVSDAGKPMAACGTFRRVAVVPAQDINFEPLLLKIPQTSIWDKDNAENEQQNFYAFDQYLDRLRTGGVTHTASVITKVKFDPRTSYPKLLFGPVKYTPAEQHAKIKELLDDPRVEALLNVSAAAVAARDTDDEVVPAQTPATPAAPAAPVEKPTATVRHEAGTGPVISRTVPPPPPRKPAATAKRVATPPPAADPDEMALPGKPNGKDGPATIDATPTAVATEADKSGLSTLLSGWDDA